jgi:hypothetical protein
MMFTKQLFTERVAPSARKMPLDPDGSAQDRERLQCQRGGFVSATRTLTHTATRLQCQRGGFVSATIVFQDLDAYSNPVAMPARRLPIRDVSSYFVLK